ncbi:AraC family transcriptional regulator [Nonomuraea sp. KC401]|uniref:AraC family transcriptional regulator n=1 Tax=unclassified Nonomuraea TaxID=2593643 RepID=UPI0010FE44EE|nr:MULTISPECIES: AraC family transcriptional regulator [unclassified Nonomuraea]NBE93072.1 helix-turn-helix domain-containing protein [Nonomuraea sp. K271]TLF80368.1 AraC family transcriptional regulator [Nonomuraea sp. KC401]
MDVLDDLLAGTRARGGVFNLTIMDPPWALHIADEAPLSLASLIRGSAWIVRDGLAPVRMEERDVAVLRGTEPYVVGDDPATAPQLRIHPGGRCEPLPGAPVDYSARLAVRTHGGRPEGAAMVVSGTYQLEGDVSRRLLAALPPVLVVPAADVAGHVMDMVLGEIQQDQPGQQSVLDRWLDLALITTLRAWFARPESQAPGWYRAQGDPVVGLALRLLHEDPAHPWTLVGLAERTGVSRASLSRRFTALVGEAPIAYLTGWRITLAADLLRTTDDTVETIARRVGYANAFALSVAFKRLRGISPTAHRRSQAA